VCVNKIVLNTHAMILKLSSARLLLELEITTETKLLKKKYKSLSLGWYAFKSCIINPENEK